MSLEKTLIKANLYPVPDIKVPQELRDFILSWHESGKPFLLLHGDYGSYKTISVKQFGASLLEDVDEEDALGHVFYVFHADFDRKFFEEYKEVLYSTKLLIIDDLLKEGKCLVELFSVINYRLNRYKKTILTTNLYPDPALYRGSVLGKIFSLFLDPNLSSLFDCSPFATRNNPFKGGSSWF